MTRRDFGLFLHGAQVQMLLQKVDPRSEVEASSYAALNLVLPGLGHLLAGHPSGMCWFVLKNHCSAEGLKVRQRYLCHALPVRPDRMNLQISSQLVWTGFGSKFGTLSANLHGRCTNKKNKQTIWTSFLVVASLVATSCQGLSSRKVVKIFLIWSESGPLGSMIALIPAIMALLNILNCPVMVNSLKSGTRWKSCL